MQADPFDCQPTPSLAAQTPAGVHVQPSGLETTWQFQLITCAIEPPARQALRRELSTAARQLGLRAAFRGDTVQISAGVCPLTQASRGALLGWLFERPELRFLHCPRRRPRSRWVMALGPDRDPSAADAPPPRRAASSGLSGAFFAPPQQVQIRRDRHV